MDENERIKELFNSESAKDNIVTLLHEFRDYVSSCHSAAEEILEFLYANKVSSDALLDAMSKDMVFYTLAPILRSVFDYCPMMFVDEEEIYMDA